MHCLFGSRNQTISEIGASVSPVYYLVCFRGNWPSETLPTFVRVFLRNPCVPVFTSSPAYLLPCLCTPPFNVCNQSMEWLNVVYYTEIRTKNLFRSHTLLELVLCKELATGLCYVPAVGSQVNPATYWAPFLIDPRSHTSKFSEGDLQSNLSIMNTRILN